MTKQQLSLYIQREIARIAQQQYEDPRQSLTYITGFLSAQLAEAALQDSHALDRFKHSIEIVEQRISK